MKYYNNMYLHQRDNIILILIVFTIILVYPASTNKLLIYIPHLLVGFLALYAMLKVQVIKPSRSFFLFGTYMMFMGFVLSLINRSGNFISILISSLRLYYPFIGLIVGGLFRKKIKPKSLLHILIFFLALQFITCFLQINNETFRIWSFNLYRSSGSEYRLNAFSWSIGRRAIGTLGNPNLLGMLVVVLNSSILILSNISIKKRLQMIIKLSCIVASVYICIYTQSRTAVLLLVFTISIILYWGLPQKGTERIVYIVVPGVVALLLLNIIQANISRNISFAALDSRFNIWQIRISQMFQCAKYEDFFTTLLGVGFHTARGYGFFDNTIIKVFVSGGIIGITFFLKTIIDAVRATIRVSKNEWKHLGLILIIIWVLGSMVAEFQEAFKLSIITFILLGYSYYPDKPIIVKSYVKTMQD